MPFIAFPVGRSVPFAPLDRVLAPYDGSSSQHQSLSRFAPKFSAFALPAKRGEFWLNNGEENRKSPRFFGASSPVFPIATPLLLSQPVSFAPRLRPTESMSWPNFAAHCASSSCRDGLRWTRDGRASFAGTSIGCCGEGKQKRPRSTKIDRGRELERADLAAGTAARRLSVCLCVCRKVR